MDFLIADGPDTGMSCQIFLAHVMICQCERPSSSMIAANLTRNGPWHNSRGRKTRKKIQLLL